MKALKLITLILPALAILNIAVQDEPKIKTFDAQKEPAATKKVIEEKYKILHKAIRDEDSETAIAILHEDLVLEYAISLPANPEGSSGDFDSYLEEIDSSETIGGFGKTNHPESSKIESKVTEFIGGRRNSMARFVETLKDNFIDEEGEYGDKGKEVKLESTTIYTDTWFFDTNSLEDGVSQVEWQLFNREVTSIEIKINGKALDLNSDGLRNILSNKSR